MEAENEENLNNLEVEDPEDQGENSSVKSPSEIEAIEDENNERNADQIENSSESSDQVEEEEEEEEEEVFPRTSISTSFLDAPGLTNDLFSAHKKLSIPFNAQTKAGGFDAFFAATLHCEDGNTTCLQTGDCFGDFIFLVCLQDEKATDLLFVYINSAWLDKCPDESGGIDAMTALVEVPTLDEDEILLLTREQVLSGSGFNPQRTGVLKKTNPRKYLFVKLLRTISNSSVFKNSVNQLTMGNETGGGDDDHARQPTDEEPPVDEPKEPGVELKATPAGSNAKVKGSKCSDKQAKALKALQINGSFAFNKGSTTTAPYDFRGGSSYGAGGSASSSNPASTNKPSNKSQQPVSKTPNKPAPKSQKKPAVKKKAQPKAKKPATPKPKAVPKPVIDLEEEEDGEEETEKQSNGRVSRSSKTASIQPTSSTASSKILEEINKATEAARQELLVLRREKESVERAHKDFKRAQLKADKDEQEKRQKKISHSENDTSSFSDSNHEGQVVPGDGITSSAMQRQQFSGNAGGGQCYQPTLQQMQQQQFVPSQSSVQQQIIMQQLQQSSVHQHLPPMQQPPHQLMHHPYHAMQHPYAAMPMMQQQMPMIPYYPPPQQQDRHNNSDDNKKFLAYMAFLGST